MKSWLIGCLMVAGCAGASRQRPATRATFATDYTPLCGALLAGPREGPTFVYLHGGPGYRSDDFIRSLGASLATTGNVLAFDQRGCGCSPRQVGGFTLQSQIADVAALIRKNTAGRVVLIGHSFGGLLATHVARAHPELLRALILLDAPLDLDLAIDRLIARCAERARAENQLAIAELLDAPTPPLDLMARVALIGQHAPACLGKLLVPAGHQPTEAQAAEAALGSGYTEEQLRNDGELFKSVFAQWPGSWKLDVEALRSIDVPTLAVWGDLDPYYPAPEREGMRTVVIPNTGHHTYREAPERVAQEIVTFMEQNAAASSSPDARR